MEDRFFISFDKTAIHYLHFPCGGARRASILIVPGAGEYAERYQEFARFLNAHEYDVYAMDLRGYGQSGGPRAFAKSFDDYGRDIQEAQYLPRIFPSPTENIVQAESSLPAAAADALRAKGHNLVPPEKPIGGSQAICIDWDEGVLTGGSDPRKDGCALGY